MTGKLKLVYLKIWIYFNYLSENPRNEKKCIITKAKLRMLNLNGIGEKRNGFIWQMLTITSIHTIFT